MQLARQHMAELVLVPSRFSASLVIKGEIFKASVWERGRAERDV